MSKRTLPVIGSQNWGSTLNNYLRAQEGRQTEVENEIKDLYAQSNNVVQTVLSSGINGTIVSTVEGFGNFAKKGPGLYYLNGDNPEKVNNGTQLTAGTNYYYIANATIVATSNLIDTIKLLINIESMTLDRKYDACYVYAVYNNSASNGSWEIKYSEINETSLNLNPYYICLGIIVKIGSLYYWNYKTMASNLSISSKKWMLDEPHASLTTYFNITKSGSNGINIGPYADTNQKCTLSVQALGINPFTEIESGTSELNADIKDFDIASYSENGIKYNFNILYNGVDPINCISYIGVTNPTINGLTYGNYRLLATALEVDNKRPLLILQKANNGDGDLDKALFNDEDFGNILYYADATELYRIKIGDAITMVASAGNGISPINANGLNPHITTLIKNGDKVRFGESKTQSFHFNTDGSNNPNNELELIIPKTINNNTSSIILTNNMNSTESIELHTNKIINLETNYSSIHLDNGILLSINEPPAKNTAFTINCIKGEYASSSSFLANKIEFRTPEISIFQFSDDSPNITFSRNSSLINSQGIKLTSYTTQLQSSGMIELKSNNIQLISSINTNPAKIRFDLSNRNDPRICLGLATGDGDETYLSPRGLYFPSSNNIEGIRIGSLKGNIGIQTIIDTDISDWETQNNGQRFIYSVADMFNFSKDWLDDNFNKDFNIKIKCEKYNGLATRKESYNNFIEFYFEDKSKGPWIRITINWFVNKIFIETESTFSHIIITTASPIIAGSPLLTIGDNSSYIKTDNNNGNILITKNNFSTDIYGPNTYNSIIVYKNIVFAKNNNININTCEYIANKIANWQDNIGRKIGEKYFWYYRTLPKYGDGGREESESQITIRRYFNEVTVKGPESNLNNITRHIFIPELRKYKVTIEKFWGKFDGIKTSLSNLFSSEYVTIDLLNNDSFNKEISFADPDDKLQIVPYNGHFRFDISYKEERAGTAIDEKPEPWCIFITITEENSDNNYVLKQLTWSGV